MYRGDDVPVCAAAGTASTAEGANAVADVILECSPGISDAARLFLWELDDLTGWKFDYECHPVDT